MSDDMVKVSDLVTGLDGPTLYMYDARQYVRTGAGGFEWRDAPRDEWTQTASHLTWTRTVNGSTHSRVSNQNRTMRSPPLVSCSRICLTCWMFWPWRFLRLSPVRGVCSTVAWCKVMVSGFELKGWAVDMGVVVKDLYIGRVGSGDRFYLRVEVRPLAGGSGLTVEHKIVSDDMQELSMAGVLIRKGGSITRDGDILACGRSVDDLRSVTRDLAPGLTPADVTELADIWDRSHLNGLRALCAHQVMPDRVDGRLPDAWWEQVPACPVSGYRAGSAWLTEDVSADIARVREILAGVTSNV